MRKLVSEELMSACVKVKNEAIKKQTCVFHPCFQVAGAEGQDINSLLGDDSVVRAACWYIIHSLIQISADEQRGGV